VSVDLAAAQRWFQDVVTDPDGIDAGLGHAGAGSGARAIEAVVNGSSTLSSRDRLALYSATYHRRLIGCLRESYPGLRHALGNELFDDFARDYLRAQPSRSYTLASLGAAWPAHLEATRPDSELPPAQREHWPDFLVDLARLERTFCEVYDAPGSEGQALPSAATLVEFDELDADVDVEARCQAVRVAPAIGLRLLDLRFPAGGYLVAVRRGEHPRLPGPRRTLIAVGRRDYVVTITDLGLAGHRLLEELSAGTRLGPAARAAGLPLPDVLRLVGEWADRGLIATIDIPERGAGRC
jgi:hypothetical protein